jgi:SAM-dependent methyltransferase
MSEIERWETRFAGEDYVFGTEPNAFLKKQASRFVRGQNALSLADGEGRNGVWLAERGLSVLSVDFSPRALAKADQLARKRGVVIRTERADLANWRWPEATFNVVVGIFMQFAEPAIRERIFAGIKRTLKPGGLVLLEGYRPEQLAYKTGGPKHPSNLYTRPMLQKAFEGWEILELREYDSFIQEGTGHVGMSALIDLIARKPGGPQAPGMRQIRGRPMRGPRPPQTPEDGTK